jgi:hypothetical protein|tara:strand:- start:1697 stop:1873 length:177 start_codon:yes stop_codon:yes gene_type:complete
MYHKIIQTLNKYKGYQLNYDSAIPQIAVDILKVVVKENKKQIMGVLDDIRKELKNEKI